MGYNYKNFLLDIDSDGIAVMTINRPHKMNAMNAEMRDELGDFIYAVAKDDEVKCVILTGAGDKSFLAGSDIEELISKKPASSLSGSIQDALLKIETNPKVFIAAINGYALGGGFELALACDVRIVSENALLGLPEVDLGVLPGAGGTQRLARTVGIGRAKEMILCGKKIKGPDSVDAGLAIKCVPQKDLISEAKGIAKRVINKAPLSIQVCKQLIKMSMSSSIEVGQYAEQLAMGLLCGTSDKVEGTSAFTEKRDPVYLCE